MSMYIDLKLSRGNVTRLIRRLEAYRRHIEPNTERLVSELVNGGAEMARFAFGSTANVEGITSGTTGEIRATGDAIYIMEFGAGIATMTAHPLAPNSPVPIYRWSYSETVGSGEGYNTAKAGLTAPGASAPGFWHFGRRMYYQVIPRHGMLDARDFVVENVVDKARKVFK